MSCQARRTFLKRIAVVGGAFAVPRASGQAVGGNEAIRLGFIGCGLRGNDLLGQFAKIAGVRIAGLCDPDRHRLERWRLKFNKTLPVFSPRVPAGIL